MCQERPYSSLKVVLANGTTEGLKALPEFNCAVQ
jgi:hypothetical protein